MFSLPWWAIILIILAVAITYAVLKARGSSRKVVGLNKYLDKAKTEAAAIESGLKNIFSGEQRNAKKP